MKRTEVESVVAGTSSAARGNSSSSAVHERREIEAAIAMSAVISPLVHAQTARKIAVENHHLRSAGQRLVQNTSRAHLASLSRRRRSPPDIS
nr:hypothetical protein Iba_chr04aCG3660 [Ipomoea batatas]